MVAKDCSKDLLILQAFFGVSHKPLDIRYFTACAHFSTHIDEVRCEFSHVSCLAFEQITCIDNRLWP